MSDPQDDFAAMLDAFGGPQRVRLQVGDRVDAKVIHIGKESLFCELSPTQEASLPREDFLDDEGQLSVKPGDHVQAYVVKLQDGIELSRRIGRDQIDLDLLESARETKMPVEGSVTGVNKGGLEVSIGGARGFCPMGQADINYVEDPQVFVGQTLSFLVQEVREQGRNVVLNRRALLAAERKEKAEGLLATLTEGQRVPGVVSRLTNFGAFVDIGGIDGLIPNSELSYGRVAHAQDVVSEGQEIEVEVIRIEPDPKRRGELRIALSLRATLPDPFVANADLLTEGTTLEGEVVRIEIYGAFVELGPGLSGLIHISELSHERVRHPSDVVALGDKVTVRVLGVDLEERRIKLSLRAALVDPASDEEVELTIGMQVTGVVNRIERYGVFVSLPGGKSALLPASESGTPRGTDLGRHFPKGAAVAVEIIEIDEKERIKVSKRARDTAEERADVEAYSQSTSQGTKGFGTLGDLFKLQK